MITGVWTYTVQLPRGVDSNCLVVRGWGLKLFGCQGVGTQTVQLSGGGDSNCSVARGRDTNCSVARGSDSNCSVARGGDSHSPKYSNHTNLKFVACVRECSYWLPSIGYDTPKVFRIIRDKWHGQRTRVVASDPGNRSEGGSVTRRKEEVCFLHLITLSHSLDTSNFPYKRSNI